MQEATTVAPGGRLDREKLHTGCTTIVFSASTYSLLITTLPFQFDAM